MLIIKYTNWNQKINFDFYNQIDIKTEWQLCFITWFAETTRYNYKVKMKTNLMYSYITINPHLLWETFLKSRHLVFGSLTKKDFKIVGRLCCCRQLKNVTAVMFVIVVNYCDIFLNLKCIPNECDIETKYIFLFSVCTERILIIVEEYNFYVVCILPNPNPFFCFPKRN